MKMVPNDARAELIVVRQHHTIVAFLNESVNMNKLVVTNWWCRHTNKANLVQTDSFLDNSLDTQQRRQEKVHHVYSQMRPNDET